MSLAHLFSLLGGKKKKNFITGAAGDEGGFLKEAHGMGRQTLESLFGTWASVCFGFCSPKSSSVGMCLPALLQAIRDNS